MKRHISILGEEIRLYFPDLEDFQKVLSFCEQPFWNECWRSAFTRQFTPRRIYSYGQGCRSLLSIGGDKLQFYPNFALFSTLGGMNLDHNFFRVISEMKTKKKTVFDKNRTLFPRVQVKTKKKKSSPKLEHFFPRIQVETCAQMHTRVKVTGGMQL